MAAGSGEAAGAVVAAGFVAAASVAAAGSAAAACVAGDVCCVGTACSCPPAGCGATAVPHTSQAAHPIHHMCFVLIGSSRFCCKCRGRNSSGQSKWTNRPIPSTNAASDPTCVLCVHPGGPPQPPFPSVVPLKCLPRMCALFVCDHRITRLRREIHPSISFQCPLHALFLGFSNRIAAFFRTVRFCLLCKIHGLPPLVLCASGRWIGGLKMPVFSRIEMP